MDIVVPDVGEVALLAILRAEFNSAYVHYHLYQTDITPSETDILTDYSANEADYSGYGYQSVGAFGTPSTSSGTTSMVAGGLLFQHNGGATSNTIYGYYVTDVSDAELLWAEKFSSSKTMATTADKIMVTPRLELA